MNDTDLTVERARADADQLNKRWRRAQEAVTACGHRAHAKPLNIASTARASETRTMALNTVRAALLTERTRLNADPWNGVAAVRAALDKLGALWAGLPE